MTGTFYLERTKSYDRIFQDPDNNPYAPFNDGVYWKFVHLPVDGTVIDQANVRDVRVEEQFTDGDLEIVRLNLGKGRIIERILPPEVRRFAWPADYKPGWTVPQIYQTNKVPVGKLQPCELIQIIEPMDRPFDLIPERKPVWAILAIRDYPER